jgi:SagB-type dehydrogenase family enzyme
VVYGARGVPLDDPAEAYHESSRLYPSLAPERPEVLHDLSVDAELARTVARAGRTHDHRPSVELPPHARLQGRLGDLLASRRSGRAEVMRPLGLDQLAALLGAAYAASPRGRLPRRRPVPSAGALYPLELYAAAAAVRGLSPALYHFQPFAHRLSLLAPLAWDELRASLVDPAAADTAATIIVLSAVFWRSRVKYGSRGYRFALLEAGHVAQNILLAATDLGLPALPVGGYYDRRLDAFVGADGLDESVLYAIAVGGAP